MFNDNDSNTSTVTNATPSQPQPPASSPGATSVTPSAPAQAQPNAPLVPQQPNAQGQQMVSNPSAPSSAASAPAPAQTSDPNAGHPAVKRASLFRSIAETLSGGPRYTIDDTGKRTPIPLSKSQISMAIALEAVSGGFAGLAAGRGKGPGAAFLGGAALGQQQVDQRRNQEEQDFANRSKALASKAAIYETNSRTLLNTAESEKYGADAIDKMIEINRASGVLDTDGGNLDNNGEPLTQAELLDQMQAGKLNATDKLGPIAGRVEVTNPDGTKRWEATHLIIKDPNAPTQLTQQDWDRFAAGKVKGYPAGVKIGTVEVPFRVKQLANEQLAAHALADYRLKDIRDTLAGTQYADKVPTSIDFSQPGIDSAMQRFQKYVSHSAQHGMDVYESLQAMGSDKRNPQTGEMQPNSDAKYVDTVAQALGGWPLLKAVHDKLESDSAALKSRAEERARGDEEIATAKQMIPVRADTAAAEAKARFPYDSQRVGAVTDEDADTIADAIKSGKQPPTLKGLYRNTAAVQAALARKGYDLARAQTDWNAVQKRLATMNGTQQVRLQQAVEFTYQSLPVLKQTYEQWKQAAGVSGFKVFNRATLAAMKNLPGNAGAAAQALETQIADITSELGTVYKGGNSSTDESLALAAKNFSADWNEATFNRAYDLVQQNLQIRRNSIETAVNPIGVSASSPYPPNAQQNEANQNAPALQSGFVRFQDSTGGIHDIPQGNLKAAQQRDPGLKVLQQ